MKAKTRIVAAVKACYDSYSDYARKVLYIPVIPPYPKVTWEAGNTPQGSRGRWIIDGHDWPMAADEVVAEFQRRALMWEDKMRRRSDPVESVDY
jgi:hypothetical protein